MRGGLAAAIVSALPLALGCDATRALPPCGAPTPEPIDRAGPPAAGAAAVYWSSESAAFSLDAPDRAWFECPRPIAHALERQPDVALAAAGSTSAGAFALALHPETLDQPVLGFGTSIEAATVANLRALSRADRDEVLTRIFDRDHGAGLDLVRVTIGTSDFTALPWYSYDDVPVEVGDPSLARFSVQRDIDDGIVEMLQTIHARWPEVRFFASPWSPPAWMKTTGVLTGGALIDDDIAIYAHYLRRFIEAYAALGIPISAMTLQNESRADNPDMPSCVVTAQQAARLAVALRAELVIAGIDTRLWIYDHNFDAALDYVGDAFADPAARAACDGVAFHDYAGDPTAMAAVRRRFPEQQIVFSEKMLWGIAGVDRVAQFFQNGATSYVSWVTMLDQDGKPNAGPNSDKPRLFTRDLATGGYWATPEHFLFALFARFVRPGASRIVSDYGDPAHVTSVAFANQDGSLVAIVANQTQVEQTFALTVRDRELTATLPAGTAGAYTWYDTP